MGENNSKITYKVASIVVGAVGITIACVLWLNAAFANKADKSDVDSMKKDVMEIKLSIERISAKLGIP